MREALTELAAPCIAAARAKKGLTQKQLGAKLGMPQSQISRLEKHPESVTYRTLALPLRRSWGEGRRTGRMTRLSYEVR